MTIDRTKAPPQAQIERLIINQPQFLHLSNGIPMVLFNTGSQEVAMIKCMFPAGNWQEPQRQVASLTARLLREGTAHLSAEEIANKVEYYGATLQTSAKYNHAEVSLFTLTKHLEPLLDTLKQVLTEATFPEQELHTLLGQAQQRLLINRERIEYLADEQLAEHTWGKQHPYGYRTTIEDLEAVQSDALLQFYQRHYNAPNCLLYVAGKLSDHDLQLIDRYLGGSDWATAQRLPDQQHPYTAPQPTKIHLPKAGSLQCSLRLSRPLFNKTHPDYPTLFVLNTVLGGFFGSRLMGNIREEKGYTYGIFSYLESLLHGGQWAISTEVGRDVYQDALTEIYKEMESLQIKLIPKDELNLVRNYLMGSLLSQMSDTFKLAATLQGIYVYGLKKDFYDNFVDTIQHITPHELRRYARQYLHRSEWSEVVVGV